MTSKYWIAFSAIEQIDSAFTLKLFDYFKDIEQAFNATSDGLKNIEGLSVKKAENFLKARDKINPDKVLSDVTNRGIKYLTFEDDRYPVMLKNIDNPPSVLYYKGDLDLVNFERTLAVVGSRKTSRYAKDAVNLIVSQLANTDICIVSGLASGIDTAAHTAALDNGLKTIGVIASGFDFVYPAANSDLYRKIENGNGIIFTEYFPTFEPLKFRFPQRNRIVSGLSYGTLVAEASIKSGALITANLTLEQGRELMCIPGLITNPNTEGIYKLLKNGATLVTSADDILEALNWEVKPAEQLKINLTNLDETEAKIMDVIEIEDKGVDEIMTATGLDLDTLLINLTTMELKGIIEQVNGDRYKRV